MADPLTLAVIAAGAYAYKRSKSSHGGKKPYTTDLTAKQIQDVAHYQRAQTEKRKKKLAVPSPALTGLSILEE